MSTVKYPNRKMYILAGLQPNEDATGGPWFTDGVLDQELLDQLASQLEWKISQMSWKQITDNKDHLTGPDNVQSRKRKEPDAGFEHDQAKEKTRRKDAEDAAEALIDRNHHGSSSAKQKTLPQTSSKAYVPHPAGYRKYPTLRELTDFVNKSRFVREDIPEANMSQLLDIMAYDDRIIKITSSDGSTPIMYKARRTIPAIEVERQFKEGRLDEDARMNAIRDFEVAKLGNGGITEIPCGRCPVFDMCEVGGPVNPSNCVYFEEWFEKLESGLSW